MNWNRKISALLILFLLLVPAIGLGQEKSKFPISVASKTVGFVPVWVAWRMGFFEREGLAVDLVLMRGAEKAAMALVGESVNVAVGSADAFITAVESNFNVAITAGIINRPSFFIMAKKNYKTFQDLRGATIGVTNISSGPAVALRYVLKAKGLEYPRDYKLQPAGPDAERTIGMSAGRIDASPLAVPFNFVAEELGFNAVGSYLEVIPDYQVSVFAVNRAWAERNRRQLVQFKRGMIQAMRWFFDNRDAGVEFVARELKLKPEHARKGYDFYKEKGLWDANTNINIPGMKTTIAIYNETNPPKPATVPEKYIDQSFLSEALKGLAAR